LTNENKNKKLIIASSLLIAGAMVVAKTLGAHDRVSNGMEILRSTIWESKEDKQTDVCP
jgi:hypothetical protein